jgi:hypothetical protein
MVFSVVANANMSVTDMTENEDITMQNLPEEKNNIGEEAISDTLSEKDNNKDKYRISNNKPKLNAAQLFEKQLLAKRKNKNNKVKRNSHKSRSGASYNTNKSSNKSKPTNKRSSGNSKKRSGRSSGSGLSSLSSGMFVK